MCARSEAEDDDYADKEYDDRVIGRSKTVMTQVCLWFTPVLPIGICYGIGHVCF